MPRRMVRPASRCSLLLSVLTFTPLLRSLALPATSSRVTRSGADNAFLSPLQELGGAATALFYQSEEGSEGRKAYAEKRAPDFSRFKRLP